MPSSSDLGATKTASTKTKSNSINLVSYSVRVRVVNSNGITYYPGNGGQQWIVGRHGGVRFKIQFNIETPIRYELYLTKPWSVFGAQLLLITTLSKYFTSMNALLSIQRTPINQWKPTH